MPDVDRRRSAANVRSGRRNFLLHITLSLSRVSILQLLFENGRKESQMGRHLLYWQNPKEVRDTLNKVVQMADLLHAQEQDLIERLRAIDEQRFYVRYGYKSLRGFCIQGLHFSRTQAQRIVTEVRTLHADDGQHPALKASEPPSPLPLESFCRQRL